MFNGGRIASALVRDIDRFRNPKKYIRIDRLKKLRKIQRREQFLKLVKFFNI